PVDLLDLVDLGDLVVEAQGVAEARAAAALDADPQGGGLRQVLLLDDAPHLGGRAFGQSDHRCSSSSRGAASCCLRRKSAIADLIASSASTLQWILTGGSESSWTISVFWIF